MANDLIKNDLKEFNLSPNDIHAKELTISEIASLGRDASIIGYNIPYYDIDGSPVRHSRTRNITAHEHVDEQFIQSEKIVRVYFPILFQKLLYSSVKFKNYHKKEQRLVFIVDDERRAAQITVQHKQLAVSIEGASGWFKSKLASGFSEFFDICDVEKLCVILWIGDGEDRKIQTEVANLALELKVNGVQLQNIRQYSDINFCKNTLIRIMKLPSLFPKHPSIKAYIRNKLDKGENNRRSLYNTAISIIADIETKGLRIESLSDGHHYFFDKTNKELMIADINITQGSVISNNKFLKYLYNNYGVLTTDTSLLRIFGTLFSSEEPVHKVNSHSIINGTSRHTNNLQIQLNSSEFVNLKCQKTEILPQRFEVTDNGSNNTLFKSANDLDTKVFSEKLEKFRENNNTTEFKWLKVINEVRCTLTKNEKELLALLYYVSPWLYGWNRLQLPIEVAVGEAGSGKSSLFELRLQIMSGEPSLKNLDTYKDWRTTMVNTGGLAVFDNLHTTSPHDILKISNQMCRLTTEQRPTMEIRQLHTSATILMLPVNCILGLTSITDVFTKSDFLQRSIVLKLNKSIGVNYYTDWMTEQLEQGGGREEWMANHIYALELFFKRVHTEWKASYKSKTRLINLEQTLMIMAKVFGIDYKHIPETLYQYQMSHIIRLDPVLQGLSEYTKSITKKGKYNFTVKNVISWANKHDKYGYDDTLTNNIKLGKYLSYNSNIINDTLYIRKTEKKEQRSIVFHVARPKKINRS